MNGNHVPLVRRSYWICLILASIFGANAGDVLADSWGWGHVTGLPYLAAAFALILIAERFDRWAHTAYYWAAIIVVRAAATNIGDIGHDLRLPQPAVMAGMAVVLAGAAWLWAARAKRSAAAGTLSTNGWYWAAMLLAGSLGTVLGDFSSATLGKGLGWGFQGGNIAATAAGAVVLAAVFLAGRNRGLQTQTAYFWLTVVLIRAAGTAAGDALAHSVGLNVSSLLSGLVFVAAVSFWHDSSPRVKVQRTS